MRNYGQGGFKAKIVQGLNDAVSAAQDAAIAAGEWPVGLPIPRQKIDAEDYTAEIFYTKSGGGKWVCNRTDKRTGTTASVDAGTRTELATILLAAQGFQTIENADIEDENRRIDAGLPEGMDFEDENAVQSHRFVSEFRQGLVYKRAVAVLEEDEGNKMYRMLCSSVGGLGLSYTAENLCAAFDSLCDNNGEFWNYLRKADRIKAEEEAKAQAEAESEAFRQSRLVTAEEQTPFVNSGRRPKLILQDTGGAPERNKIPATPENLKQMRQDIMRSGGFGKQ